MNARDEFHPRRHPRLLKNISPTGRPVIVVVIAFNAFPFVVFPGWSVGVSGGWTRGAATRNFRPSNPGPNPRAIAAQNYLRDRVVRKNSPEKVIVGRAEYAPKYQWVPKRLLRLILKELWSATYQVDHIGGSLFLHFFFLSYRNTIVLYVHMIQFFEIQFEWLFVS